MNVPRIVAQRDGDYLVLTNEVDRLGYVIDNDTHRAYPETTIDTILARGYWEEYRGRMSVKMALSRVTVL